MSEYQPGGRPVSDGILLSSSDATTSVDLVRAVAEPVESILVAY